MSFIFLLLDKYVYECTKYEEPDGTVTLSMNVLDIVENGNAEEAKEKIAKSILEYAIEFYAKMERVKTVLRASEEQKCLEEAERLCIICLERY